MFATKRVAFLKKTTVILKPCCIKSSFRYAQEDPYMEFAFVFHRKHAVIMIVTKVSCVISEFQTDGGITLFLQQSTLIVELFVAMWFSSTTT